MIRVLVADDHPMVRIGLKRVLSDVRDIEVVGEVQSGDEAVAKLKADRCDIVLLDINMPGKSGVDTLRELRAINPHIKVLVLSMYPEEQYAAPLLKAGASGYLTKETAPEQLVTAIRTVAAGRRYVTPRFAEILAERIVGNGERPPHESLSAREYQVFLQIARGESVSGIAGTLALSVKTISTYRTNILKKMGIEKNADMTMYALQHGLIEIGTTPGIRSTNDS